MAYEYKAKSQYNTIDYYTIKEKAICSDNRMNNLKEDILTRLEKEYPEALKQPSSTSGKYHPYVECQPYGLLLHSLGTVMVAMDLLRLGEFIQLVNNIRLLNLLKFACFFHDIGKIINSKDYKSHPINGANWLKENYHDTLVSFGYSECELNQYLYCPINTHMDFSNNNLLELPSKLVEMADYIASRPYTNTFRATKIDL